MYGGKEDIKGQSDASTFNVLGNLLRAAGCEIIRDAGPNRVTYQTPAGNHLTVEQE